jgi:hypothetical protein
MLVLAVEVLDGLLSMGEDRLLAPGLESLNGLALVRVAWTLLHLGRLGILLGCLLVLLLDLLDRFDHLHKLLLPKVKDRCIDSFPLLL